MIDAGQPIFDATASSMDSASESNQEEESSTETSPAESSPDTEETSTESDGDEKVENVPKDLKSALHKDARFKRVIEERNRLRRELEEAREAKQNQRQEEPKAPSSKPAWFAKYFGDDDEAWQGFQQMTASAKTEAKAEAVAELKREQQETTQQADRWNSWVNEQVNTLEEEGESFDRNALFKLMEEYRPTDDEGNLDFRRGLEILNLKDAKPSNIEAKRKAGSLANGPKKTVAEPSKKNVVTPNDIRKWRLTGEI